MLDVLKNQRASAPWVCNINTCDRLVQMATILGKRLESRKGDKTIMKNVN